MANPNSESVSSWLATENPTIGDLLDRVRGGYGSKGPTVRAPEEFEFENSVSATVTGCSTTFNRQFNHPPFYDGETRVQAGETPDEIGFNRRFNLLETDLDSIKDQFDAMFTCLATLRGEVSSMVSELQEKINDLQDEIYRVELKVEDYREETEEKSSSYELGMRAYPAYTLESRAMAATLGTQFLGEVEYGGKKQWLMQNEAELVLIDPETRSQAPFLTLIPGKTSPGTPGSTPAPVKSPAAAAAAAEVSPAPATPEARAKKAVNPEIAAKDASASQIKDMIVDLVKKADAVADTTAGGVGKEALKGSAGETVLVEIEDVVIDVASGVEGSDTQTFKSGADVAVAVAKDLVANAGAEKSGAMRNSALKSAYRKRSKSSLGRTSPSALDGVDAGFNRALRASGFRNIDSLSKATAGDVQTALQAKGHTQYTEDQISGAVANAMIAMYG